MNIEDLANEIFHNEFESSNNSLTKISGWLDNNLGKLNTLLNTEFSGSAGVVANMGLEEQNIYKEMYMHHFYTKETRNTLRGIANDSNGNILSVKDGDNAISFVNKNEVSKVYRSLATDTAERLQELVYKYNLYRSSPKQVGGIEASIPSGIYE
jgi:hypothetical protein